MISAAEIKEKAAQNAIDPGVVEKDYVLSKILFGLSSQAAFQSHFAFKGGTAVKKLFYPSWRYSEDLDFTVIKSLDVTDVEKIFTSAAETVLKTVNLRLTMKDLVRAPKAMGEKPIVIGLKLFYDGPLRKTSGQKNNIRVDLTFDEVVVENVISKTLTPLYSDDTPFPIPVYSLEEIVAEKMRSILQRGKSRDYYDVWEFLKFHQTDLHLGRCKEVFLRKCEFKKVPFGGIEDFTKSERLEQAKGFWKRGLSHQVNQLPDFEKVAEELKVFLGGVFR